MNGEAIISQPIINPMSANKLVLGLDIFCFSIQAIINPIHNNMNKKNKKKGTSMIFSISNFKSEKTYKNKEG